MSSFSIFSPIAFHLRILILLFILMRNIQYMHLMCIQLRLMLMFWLSSIRTIIFCESTDSWLSLQMRRDIIVRGFNTFYIIFVESRRTGHFRSI